MKRIVRNTVIASLLVPFLVGVVLAEPQPAQPPQADVQSKDFSITVSTNKDIYHNADVLTLTVVLVNDDAKPARIEVSAPPEPNRQGVGEIAAGMLDGRNVEVAIVPPRPPIIGVATLTRLGPSPMAQRVPGEPPPPPEPNIAQFVLPLFGRPLVPMHSTRIISAANILITLPEPNEPNEPLTTQVAGEPQPPEIIPAVGEFVAPGPGYYLLNCRIMNPVDTWMAQRIIQVLPAPPPPPPPQ